MCKYLLGVWKRNLEWREFGLDFNHLRSSSSVVEIQETKGAAAETGTRFLDWFFGMDPQDLKVGYSMQFFPAREGEDTPIEWIYKGRVCRGDFNPSSAMLTLNFRDKSGLVTNASYRAVDDNTMAVCLVETDARHTPVIQYGLMIRLAKGSEMPQG
ncbi:unnamed protein product [Choristocarpus tenellus]